MATRFKNGSDKGSTSNRTPTPANRRSKDGQDHYRSLVENAAVVLWTAPHDSFQYSYISPEAEKIFGYPQEECLKAGFLEKVIPFEEWDWVKEYTRLAVQENHTYQIEYHIVTAKGKLKTLRDNVRLVYKDGKPHQKVGATVDISVYSQTMDELQASNRKFFSAFFSFPIPAAIFRISDGRCIDVNNNFLRVSGIDRNDIVGKSPFELNVWINAADRDQVLSRIKNNMRLDKYPVVIKDAFSRVRNVLVSAERFDSNGEPSMLLMFHDVTDQIKTEQRLQQINRELETFMYKSSHNLKGPVASIKGLLYLTSKQINDPQSQQYLDLMVQSADGLETTLKELMDIARLKQGVLKIEVVDLKLLLNEVKNKLKFMPEWQNVSLQIHVQQTYPFYSDPSLLYSILQNLVENAVKYKEEKRETFIEVKAVIRKKAIEIVVKDNGIGIPEEQHERVFEMFYRAHSKANGSGLGLYIVRNSVEKLGGKISLQSTPGVGSSFQIALPNLLPAKKG